MTCSITKCERVATTKGYCTKHYISKWGVDRRVERRKKLIDMLGGKCVSCGVAEGLQFDHIDPASMKYRVATIIQGKWERVLEEANKCQLLCNDCHWDKTRLERGLDHAEHGTVNMYVNYQCRCKICKEAWTKYFYPKNKAYRSRKRQERGVQTT